MKRTLYRSLVQSREHLCCGAPFWTQGPAGRALWWMLLWIWLHGAMSKLVKFERRGSAVAERQSRPCLATGAATAGGARDKLPGYYDAGILLGIWGAAVAADEEKLT